MIFDKTYKKLCINKAKKICNVCSNYVIGSVLDIGSGRGYIAKEISKRVNKVPMPGCKEP